jgi:hypothetical protein
MSDEVIEIEMVVVHSNEAHYLHYNPASSIITDAENADGTHILRIGPPKDYRADEALPETGRLTG